MRVGPVAIMVALAVATATAAPERGRREVQAPPAVSAAALLKAGRAAIGSDAARASVKSLRLKGEARVLNQYFGQDPRARVQFDVMPLELRVLLPDRYLRIREHRLGEQVYIVQTGFSGATLLSSGRNSPDQIDAQRRIFAQFMLLLLLKTDTPMPLTLRDGPVKGSTLEFTGANDFHGYLDLDETTHLPARLRYRLAMRTMIGELTGGIEDVLVVVTDYRSVGGLKLPFHEAVSENGELMNETTYRSIEVNAPLTEADFPKGTSRD